MQTPEGNIDYTYACGAKPQTVIKGTDSLTYTHDGDLLTGVTAAGLLNLSLGFTYNNNFQPDTFTYAGASESVTYDNDGLLTGAGAYTISRNALNGLPESVTSTGYSRSRTFNGYGELDSENCTVNASSVGSWSVSRDSNGRIENKSETVDGGTTDYVYSYDTASRLRTVTRDGLLVEEYRYDGVPYGARTYEFNSLRGITGRTYSYSDDPVNFVDPTGLDRYADTVTVVTSGADIVTSYATPPTSPAGAVAFTVAIIADKTNSIVSLSNDGIGKDLTSTGLSAIGTGAAVVGGSVMGTALSSFGLGTTIGSMVNGVPVYGDDRNISDWWADKIWDSLHPCSD